MIIAGYGRVGQLVGEMLDRHKVPYLAIDLDPARVAAERKAGKPVYFGDGSHPEFLRACGIDRALALVITLDTRAPSRPSCRQPRQERSDITIVARARDAQARHRTLRARRRRCGAGDHRGLPAAERGGAEPISASRWGS